MMATVEKRPTFSPSTSSAYLVTLTLLEMLLFSPTVLSDCDQPCSPSFPMANQCQSVTPGTYSHCGYIHETSTTPSAPTNLRFRDFSYTFGNKTTLGLNITWQLPENYTGLRGFFVHVMKTSYPVGSQHCKKVAFPELTTALQRPSEVSFSMDCLHNVNVDGKYDITVTSLDSGMSVKKSHHTQNCYERPEVEGCLVVRDCVKDGCRGGVPSSDDWIPPHPKAHAVYEDHMWKVRVEFYVYPGNFWLTYRVNLYSYHSDTVPPKFSHHVNSNGSSGPIFHEFWNVTPGKYQARVKIYSGDAVQVKSEDVVIMEPTTVSSTVEPTSPTTPPTSHSTNVGEPKSALNIPIAALAGIGVGVFVAVLLVALLVIWKVKISKREPFSRGGNFTDGVMPYSDETSDPTNNMLHSEADRGAVQGVYPSPYASSPYRMDGGAGEEFGCGDSCVCDNDLRIHKVDFSKLDLIDLNHADLGSVAPSGITV